MPCSFSCPTSFYLLLLLAPPKDWTQVQSWSTDGTENDQSEAVEARKGKWKATSTHLASLSPPLSLMQPWVPHLSPRLHLDENHKLTLEENLTSPAWWIKNFSLFLILDYYFWWSRLPRERTTSSYCLKIWHNHLHINWLTQATIMFAPRLLDKEEKKNTKKSLRLLVSRPVVVESVQKLKIPKNLVLQNLQSTHCLKWWWGHHSFHSGNF